MRTAIRSPNPPHKVQPLIPPDNVAIDNLCAPDRESCTLDSHRSCCQRDGALRKREARTAVLLSGLLRPTARKPCHAIVIPCQLHTPPYQPHSTTFLHEHRYNLRPSHHELAARVGDEAVEAVASVRMHQGGHGTMTSSVSPPFRPVSWVSPWNTLAPCIPSS